MTSSSGESTSPRRERGFSSERNGSMMYDVVIVGGGPAGLSAALALGRGRKRVLLSDAGPRRNGAAERVYNFVTRDGTPPDEFRSIARIQLAAYPSVEVRDRRVRSIDRERGAFRVGLGADAVVSARRILLCTGMVDQMLPIEGFGELWGHGIFQCPYCHGWELRGRRWGYLASTPEKLEFALLCRGWTPHVVAFTSGQFDVSDAWRDRLGAASIHVEARPIRRLHGEGQGLRAVEVEGGDSVPCDVLLAHPPQRQVDLVRSLGVDLDENHYVRIDAATRETSVPGIYAAGDLTGPGQSAILGAASGALAAGAINHALTAELATTGALP